jgi:hypothetical protein
MGKSENSRNQRFSYYICLRMEGSGSTTLVESVYNPYLLNTRKEGIESGIIRTFLALHTIAVVTYTL